MQGPSFDVDDVATPFDARGIESLHQDRIEAAGRLAADHRQIAARRGDHPRALLRRDAFERAAEATRESIAAGYLQARSTARRRE
jgi:hypothetical protein